MSPPYVIQTTNAPRAILKGDFATLHDELPISGGWGYNPDDACIIELRTPAASNGRSPNVITVEQAFVEMRLYEELIIFRPKCERFSGISWMLHRQQLHHRNDRILDHLIFDVSAFHEKDWEALMAEPEALEDAASLAARQQRREALMLRFVEEFWFDVTCVHHR